MNYLVGVVSKEEALRFKRIVFRATKGNCWIVISDIEYSRHDIELIEAVDDEGKPIRREIQNPKSAFVIVYQGGMTDFLR